MQKACLGWSAAVALFFVFVGGTIGYHLVRDALTGAFHQTGYDVQILIYNVQSVLICGLTLWFPLSIVRTLCTSTFDPAQRTRILSVTLVAPILGFIGTGAVVTTLSDALQAAGALAVYFSAWQNAVRLLYYLAATAFTLYWTARFIRENNVRPVAARSIIPPGLIVLFLFVYPIAIFAPDHALRVYHDVPWRPLRESHPVPYNMVLLTQGMVAYFLAFRSLHLLQDSAKNQPGAPREAREGARSSAAGLTP